MFHCPTKTKMITKIRPQVRKSSWHKNLFRPSHKNRQDPRTSRRLYYRSIIVSYQTGQIRGRLSRCGCVSIFPPIIFIQNLVFSWSRVIWCVCCWVDTENLEKSISRTSISAELSALFQSIYFLSLFSKLLP